MRAWILPTAAVSFGAGILIAGGRVEKATGLVLVVAGAAGLAAAIVLGEVNRRRSRRVLETAGLLAPNEKVSDDNVRSVWRPLALVVGFTLLGAGWGGLRQARVEGVRPLDGRFVRFHGTVVSDTRLSAFGWAAEARLARLELGDRTLSLSIRVRLQGRRGPPDLEPGQLIRGTGMFQAPGAESSGFERHLVGRGIQGIISIRALQSGATANPALRLANASRRALSLGAERALPKREAGLLLGLAVGDTDGLDPEVAEDFRATGLGHLLAVSGSNVAMFLVPVLGVVFLLGGRPVTRFGIGVSALGFFVLLTRWEPSVLRASTMAALALLGVLVGRPRSTPPLLGAAVLLLLIADPGLARSLGFQLSVAATAGIAAFAHPIAARLPWLPGPVAMATGATVGAQIAVIPMLLFTFGIVPGVTLLANLLAFPAVPLALSTGLLASGAALAWEPLGVAFGKLAMLPLGYLVALADRLARAPVPSLTSGGLILPLAAAALGVVSAWRLRCGRRGVASFCALLVLGAVIWSAALRAGEPNSMTTTFLDVGQGDAAVVRTPEGATVLVDAGPEEDDVAALLAAMRVRRIDLAVATHAHADHVEGFPAVLSRYPVGLLLEPGCPADSPSYERFRRALKDEDVRVHHARGGERFTVGDMVVDVLGPDACALSESGPNDDSVVLSVRYGEATVLFPGDAERPAQQDLIDDSDPLNAAVLKVPHHGGDTSLSAFFTRVGAEVAVVSVGQNDYGHPAKPVLVALERMGAVVVRTDQVGDVTVRFELDGVVVEAGEADVSGSSSTLS